MWNGEQLTKEDLSQPIIDALSAEGIDVNELLQAAAGDEAAFTMALQDGLSALIKKGSEIDLAALMTETLSGTELGSAQAGVMEAGYLDGIGGIDTDLVEHQMALASAHVGDGMVQGLNQQLPRVRAAANRLANAAMAAVRNTWEIRSPSRVFRGFSRNAGESLALGFEDLEPRVRKAMYRITNPGMLGVDLSGGAMAGTAAQAAGAGNGPVYNITVPNATIRSESEAKSLLKKATKMTSSHNRGVGR